MFEFLKHRSKGLEARADGGYTDLLVQLATANASGGTATATETSAVEFSVGLLGPVLCGWHRTTDDSGPNSGIYGDAD